ncbi:hypothetical protein Srot_2498 [Segniliparus rotundus DSM 44985]|uniref:Uncharacterized protein n=1 Tax=Segniliparus rotundus (strain ATCC BAA-972 / CDC 1076 / CIP 108378 / DSM 44985 / JCM 13578) TaxID=640132 RepID=D6ZBI3_SEGRD|nr:hypothetical protein [Segniliparus rotundus]ADG98935.1 hypothetical protein Srot_2498 [Segniliparus rotundus DSM 44985]
MVNSNHSFFDGGVIGSGPDDLLGDEEYSPWNDTGSSAAGPAHLSAPPDVIGAEPQQSHEAVPVAGDPASSAADIGANASSSAEKVGDVMSGLHGDRTRDGAGAGDEKDEKKEADAPVSDINNAVGAPPASNFDPMGLLQPLMQIGQMFGQAPQQMMQPMQQMMQPMQQMMQQLPQQMQSLMGQTGQGWQGSAADSAMGHMGKLSETAQSNGQDVAELSQTAGEAAQSSEEAIKKQQEAMQKGQEGNKQAQEGAQNMNPAQMVHGVGKVTDATGEGTANLAKHTSDMTSLAAKASEKAMPKEPPDISKLLGPLQSMMQMPMQMLQQAPQMLQGLGQMPQQMMQQGMQMMQGFAQMAGKGGAGGPAGAELGDALKDGGKLEGAIDSTANIGGLGGGGAGLGGGGAGGHERTLSAAPGSANSGGATSSGSALGGVGGGSSSSGGPSLSTRPAGMGGSGGGMGMMPAHQGGGESKGGSKVPDYLKGSVMGQNQIGDIPQVSPSVLGAPHEGDGEAVHG